MLQPLVFHGAYGYDSFLPRSWSVVLTALYPGGKASDPLVEHEALLRIDGDRVDDEDDDDSTGATIEAKCFDLPSFRGCEGHWSLCYAHADLRSPRQWHDCLAVPAISSNAAAATVRMHLDLNRPFPDPESAVLVRATFTFTSNGLATAPTASSSTALRSLPCESFTSNDVAILFPNDGAEGGILWSERRMLVSSSAYFRDLFEGGFVEGTQYLPQLSRWQEYAQHDLQNIMQAERAKIRDETPPPQKKSKSSHAEVEVPSGDRKGKGRARDGDEDAQTPGRVSYVVVRDTSMATYKLALSWLDGTPLEFAPLPLLSKPCNPTAPDAVYALADFLQLGGLKEIALQNYFTQLKAANCLNHLLGEFSCRYPELRRAALQTTLANIDEVRRSNGPDAIGHLMQQDLDAELKSHLAEVVVALLKAPGPPSANRSASSGSTDRAARHGREPESSANTSKGTISAAQREAFRTIFGDSPPPGRAKGRISVKPTGTRVTKKRTVS